MRPSTRTTIKYLTLLFLLLGSGLTLYGLWLPIKAQVAQLLLERAWSISRNTGKPQKAWPWADSWPVARLSIPSLDLDAIILKEAGGEGLAFGPVLLDQSAPLDQKGTTVIAAHRDTHFKALADLHNGAFIKIEPFDGAAKTFQVDKMRVARWDESGLIKESDEQELVLSSCWPFDSIKPGPLRFIAEARKTEQAAALLP
ncbi:class GN sortase [uncultured Cohaesibacter sp.]|uniref:class GN sortase n=1 Tax=uncultured Cohaesibacter sp. TaxID=1002546 RepID=UPI00292F2644|nr:class GN sortase [uncultured Cohaesibacter sp.]